MRAQKKKNSEVDLIVDAILADNLSVVPEALKSNPTVYLNKCLKKCPPIENLQRIVETIYGHERLTDKELQVIKPAVMLNNNFKYFMEKNNIITFIKIFYPPDYTFNVNELYKITDLVFGNVDRSENHRGQRLLKLLQYYTAQFKKQLK